MTKQAIVVSRVSKYYGSQAAVRDLSLEVGMGEICAIVGPNGAGKTTLVEMIEGLRRPDQGRVELLGVDPRRERRRVAERIGVQLQSGGLHPRLRVREAVHLCSKLYRRTGHQDEILEFCGLATLSGKRIGQLSGGQQKRVALALALVNRPEVLFLDELTTGLDPEARREMWGMLASLRRQGVTVLFVTHYMEEAEYLGDRVAVMVDGQLVAIDSPAAVIEREAPGFRLVTDAWTGPLPEPGSVFYRVESRQGRTYLYTKDPHEAEVQLRSLLPGISARVESTDLEDAYLGLVGRRSG